MATDEDDMNDDDFQNETRMLVLSFMGLLPAELFSQSPSASGSLTSSGSSAERQRRSLPEQSSFDSTTSRKHERSSSDTWQLALPSLPETSLVDRVMSQNELESDSPLWPQAMDDLPHPPLAEMNTPDETEDTSRGGIDDIDHSNGIRNEDENFIMDEDEPDVISNRLKKAKRDRFEDLSMPGAPRSDLPPPELPGPQAPKRSPPSRSKSVTGTPHNVERQTSNTSSASDATDMSDMSSLMMSTRSTGSRASNYVDIQQLPDMDQFVQQGILPPQVLPLQHQLNQEMEQTRKQSLAKSKSPCKSKTAVTPPVSASVRPPFVASASVMTPQTEVAEQLRIIGDTAQQLYGADVEKAFNSVMKVPKDKLSYDLMEQILIELIENIPGMSRRVAMVMLLSQRLVMYGRDLHKLVNYTVRFLMSKMATYILTHGGWSQVVALEDMEVPPVLPTDVIPGEDVIPGGDVIPGEDVIPGVDAIPRVEDRDQVDSLPVPSDTLHEVSTSTTLVPDDDDQTNIESVTDSGIQASDGNTSVTWTDVFPSVSTSEGLPRDTTLDSIASLPHDITPAEVRNFQDVSAVNNNICDTKTSDETLTTDPTQNVVDETAVKQARVLRQVSEKLNNDVERERQLSSMLQTFGMVTLGSAIVISIAMLIYKRVVKK